MDIRNIHPDFLEDNEEQNGDDDPVPSDQLPPPPTYQGQHHQPESGYASQPSESVEVEDKFEWVPGKVPRGNGLDDGHHPPHPPRPLSHLPRSVGRTFSRTAAMNIPGSTPSLRHGVYPWTPWGPSMSNFLDLRATSYYPPSMAQGRRGLVYDGSMPGSHLSSRKPSPKSGSPHLPTPDTQGLPNHGQDPTTSPDPQPLKREHSDLQLYLHILWELNLRLALATSLPVNYPSPTFTTLPIKLPVTG